MDAPDLHGLLDQWQVRLPRVVRHLDSGTNNLSYRVTTPDADLLLRMYRYGAERERIEYEHALLSALQQAHLPFTVPAPLASASGETCLATRTGDRLAALFPWLPGEHPTLDLGSLQVCARALAELDRAMADLDLHAPSGGLGLLGDLNHVHQAVPDPVSVADDLTLSRGERTRIARHMEMASRESERVYAGTLPRQIVHRDLDPSNLYMTAGRVSAVFDFEVARPDLRAFDLAIAAMTFSTEVGVRDTFIRSYVEILPLDAEELLALPALMLIYRAMSLVSREGRRREGHASEEAVLARARSLLAEAERQRDLI